MAFAGTWMDLEIIILHEVSQRKTPRQLIKKQRHYFANKGLSSQGYGFFSGHLWM